MCHVVTATISLHTRGNTDILDITEQVAGSLQTSGLGAGILTVFCPSSTSAITTIEYESGCLADLRRLFDEILPTNRDYAHNTRWGDGNGHSHVRAAILGASLTIPFRDNRLILGTWQQIIYVDFDTHPRTRQIIIHMIGE